MGIETAAIVAAGASTAGSIAGNVMAGKAQMKAANSADARLAAVQQQNMQLQDRAIGYQTPELDRFQRMLNLMETNATDTTQRYESNGYGNIMRLLNPAVGGTTNLDGSPLGRGSTIAAAQQQQAVEQQQLSQTALLAQRQGAFLGSEASGYGRLAAGLTEDRASLDAYKGAAQGSMYSGIANAIGNAPLNAMAAYTGFGGTFPGAGAKPTPLPAGGGGEQAMTTPYVPGSLKIV